jgi:flagellar biosynthesis protein FlhF
MTIKKFTGNTRDEAIKNAKDELGQSVVIMNVREVRPGGITGIFKKSTYEVTAALEDDAVPIRKNPSAALGEGGHFDAVAGEKGVVNHIEARKQSPQAGQSALNTLAGSKNDKNKDILAEDSLKSAFQAVNEVINKSSATDHPADPDNSGKTNNNVNPTSDHFPDDAQSGSYIQNSQVEEKNNLSRDDNFTPLYRSVGKEADTKQQEIKKPALNRQFVSMLYNSLLSNEVDEVYVNQILKDMEKVIQSGNNLDYLLSNVYQKMVLMMGKPKTIVCGSTKPLLVFLIGPTGVGKTTTIAKLASRYKLNYGKEVGLLTTDTYRIAATDQLKTYANILDIPLDIVLTKNDINEAIAKMGGTDLILVDTAGFSHKNASQRKDMEEILNTVDPAYDKEVFLVLSATTKYRDLKEIVDTYKTFTDFSLIFTKLDETDLYGNILSTKLYAGTNLSYVCNGQGVPDDLNIINIQHIVKQLLGGK